MFDYDEIEDEVEAKGDFGEDTGKAKEEPKEEPKAAGGASKAADRGIFDFDDMEDEEVETKSPVKNQTSSTASKGSTFRVCLRFFYTGSRWSRDYEMGEGATVLELKKKVAEGGSPEDDSAWFQILKAGRSLQDSDVLKANPVKGSALQLDFSYRPPADASSPGKRGATQEALSSKPAARPGTALAVTVAVIPSLGITTVVNTTEGTTVKQLKEQMATLDTTGQTKAADLELKLEGTAKPLAADDIITSRTTWLALCERMAGS